jgi:hypothetical protein
MDEEVAPVSKKIEKSKNALEKERLKKSCKKSKKIFGWN